MNERWPLLDGALNILLLRLLQEALAHDGWEDPHAAIGWCFDQQLVDVQTDPDGPPVQIQMLEITDRGREFIEHWLQAEGWKKLAGVDGA